MNQICHKLPVILILSSLLLYGCKKDDKPKDRGYDMFPLKQGNEFFYSYSYTQHGNNGYYVKGKEKWTVVAEENSNNITKYNIESKLYGIHVRTYEIVPYKTVDIDTTIITDSVWHFIISEIRNPNQISFSIKSSLSSEDNFFWSIIMNRYKIYNTETNIYLWRSGDWNAEYKFLPDQGLTGYYLTAGSPGFINRARETLIQDSLSIH